jgi:hypothetical protein
MKYPGQFTIGNVVQPCHALARRAFQDGALVWTKSLKNKDSVAL